MSLENESDIMWIFEAKKCVIPVRIWVLACNKLDGS